MIAGRALAIAVPQFVSITKTKLYKKHQHSINTRVVRHETASAQNRTPYFID
jgi:hypothetical protein